MYTNSDDEEFVKVLLRKAILNSEKNSALIDTHTTNWEVERIALMDKLVMQLAITELVEFSAVPVKVTLNEYIEIAKDYCTAKSSTFVNGILDKIVKEMRVNGSLTKAGRGLIGEGQDQGGMTRVHKEKSRRGAHARRATTAASEGGQVSPEKAVTGSVPVVKKRKRT